MTQQSFTLAIIYGGRSAEHEVSLRSAHSIYQALNRTKYTPIPIFLSPGGGWWRMPTQDDSFTAPDRTKAVRTILSPDPNHGGFISLTENGWEALHVDVLFPVLHGTYGEDGTIQGLFELADKPYVGCGVLASAVGMDKVFMKNAFIRAGVKVGPFFWFTYLDWKENRASVMEKLKRSNFPVFVKPANLGSSVGISMVKTPDAFEKAVEHALPFDHKILVEDGIQGRELEVSVLGNEKPEASLPGEVIAGAEFYDYEEKYLRDTAELKIPAELKPEVIEEAKRIAVRSFQAVNGSGLGRVDMFLTPSGELIANEINTLPGFTSISMYPKLWEISGLSYPDLLDRLVQLAVERHTEKRRLVTSRHS